MLDLINIALNCPATQSSICTWSSHPTPELDAAIANNGDPNSNSFFHTDLELAPWWQVDLQDAFILNRAVIHNRLEHQDRLKDFSLIRSLDGKSWIEVYRHRDPAPFNELTIEIPPDHLARYVRVRLNGLGMLHFRELQLFGRRAAPAETERLARLDAEAENAASPLPPGRSGQIADLDGFHIFVDEQAYGTHVKHALLSGGYEGTERALVKQFLRPGDRVLEIGTAVGVVAMTAARQIGAENILTFDANPEIVVDAQANFKRNGLEAIDSRVGVLACRRHFKPDQRMDFFIANEFWASRLGARPDSGDIVKSVSVPVVCLEAVIAAHRANVLVCDIEGGEVNLLTDADLFGIRLIIMETHYWAAGEWETDRMIRELILQGFSLNLAAQGGHVVVLRRG